MIIVPNATLVNQVITNYSKPTAATSVSIPLYLPLDSDPAQTTRVFDLAVEQVVDQCAEWLEPNTTPIVRFGSVDERGLKLTVTARAMNYPSQFRLQHEIINIILNTCKQEGLQLIGSIAYAQNH
jgi:small-conductance mechanosensitive channel